MTPSRCFVAGAILGLLSSAALAFQESKGGPAPSGGAQVAPKLDITPNEKTLVAPTTGPEIRIPGLGKLGVLPKLDFGLELLYGVNDPQPPGPPSVNDRADDKSDGVQIRGRLKHQF